MSRRSNKSICDIKLTIQSSTPDISITIPSTSASIKDNNVDNAALERKRFGNRRFH